MKRFEAKKRIETIEHIISSSRLIEKISSVSIKIGKESAVGSGIYNLKLDSLIGDIEIQYRDVAKPPAGLAVSCMKTIIFGAKENVDDAKVPWYIPRVNALGKNFAILAYHSGIWESELNQKYSELHPEPESYNLEVTKPEEEYMRKNYIFDK